MTARLCRSLRYCCGLLNPVLYLLSLVSGHPPRTVVTQRKQEYLWAIFRTTSLGSYTLIRWITTYAHALASRYFVIRSHVFVMSMVVIAPSSLRLHPLDHDNALDDQSVTSRREGRELRVGAASSDGSRTIGNTCIVIGWHRHLCRRERRSGSSRLLCLDTTWKSRATPLRPPHRAVPPAGER